MVFFYLHIVKKYFVILLSLSLFACSDLKKEERIGLLNEGIERLDDSALILHSLVDEDFEKYSIESVRELEKLKNTEDTISLEAANGILKYKSLKYNFERITESIDYYSNEIDSSRAKLNQLIFDIENSVGDKKEYDRNISEESLKLEVLKEQLEKMKFTKDSCIHLISE